MAPGYTCGIWSIGTVVGRVTDDLLAGSSVWCGADLQAIIDSGQGDRPVKDLRFRCTKCGSRLTDSAGMAKDALGVQPWRAEAG
jgi:hypothetical protein